MRKMKSLLGIVGGSGLADTEEFELVNPALRFQSKEPGSQGRYLYRGYFALRNLSGEPRDVMTGGLSQEENVSDEGVGRVRLSYDGMSIDGHLVIPSVADLKLVSLNAFEVALLDFELKSYTKLNRFEIEYAPSDPYGNRFGYWSGSLKSSVCRIPNH